MIASKKAEGLAAGLAAEDLGGEAEGGWGDDDLKLDDEEDAGDEFRDAEEGSVGEGDGWAADDDLEIPPELEATPVKDDAGGQDDGYFVAPVRGVPPTQHWCNNSALPVDHILQAPARPAVSHLAAGLTASCVGLGPGESEGVESVSREREETDQDQEEHGEAGGRARGEILI